MTMKEFFDELEKQELIRNNTGFQANTAYYSYITLRQCNRYMMDSAGRYWNNFGYLSGNTSRIWMPTHPDDVKLFWKYYDLPGFGLDSPKDISELAIDYPGENGYEPFCKVLEILRCGDMMSYGLPSATEPDNIVF